jgi:hypothetical protein
MTKKIKPVPGEYYKDSVDGGILLFTDEDSWVSLQTGDLYAYRWVNRWRLTHLPDFKYYVDNYFSSDNIEEEELDSDES